MEGLAGSCSSGPRGELDETLIAHPKLAGALLDGGSTLRFLQRQVRDGHPHLKEVFVPVLFDRHWALLVGNRTGGIWSWTYFDGCRFSLFNHVERLIGCLQIVVGGFGHQVKCVCEVEQLHGFTCGTIALAHLMKYFGIAGYFSPEVVLQLHQWLLLHQSDDGSENGLGPDVLVDKGVPFAVAKSRASDAIMAIGHQLVHQALSSRNTWHSLKLAAGRPGVNFKFLKPDELEDYIAVKAQTKFGVEGKKRKKASLSPSSTRTELKLILEHSHCTQDIFETLMMARFLRFLLPRLLSMHVAWQFAPKVRLVSSCRRPAPLVRMPLACLSLVNLWLKRSSRRMLFLCIFLPPMGLLENKCLSMAL